MREELNFYGYPEDNKMKDGVSQFREDFRHLDPEIYMGAADDFYTETIDEDKDVALPIRDRAYDKPATITEVYDIKLEDSAKFGSQL